MTTSWHARDILRREGRVIVPGSVHSHRLLTDHETSKGQAEPSLTTLVIREIRGAFQGVFR